mmetsp:Transcript_11503/g.29113  ORF Transcript_11503/g.29113 Transcript_11503/m.29113 type:complete len:604 (-) Transcript_11503:269-2080(-)
MGGPIIFMHGSQDAAMTTQVITCLNDRGDRVNAGQVAISADYSSTVDFDSSTDFDSTEFHTKRNVKPMMKMSSLKQFSTLKKMPSTSRVAWGDTESIASCSMRSSTDKTIRIDSSLKTSLKKPTNNVHRMPTFYNDDLSTIATSKISRSLSKYDDDLSNILLNQAHDATEPIVAVTNDNLQKIKLLGSGQFCNVHSVAGSLPLLNQDPSNEQAVGKKSIYALKSINPKRVGDDDELIIAASDLASEAIILSELDHKNIIKLRGLSCETFSKSFVDGIGSAKNRNASQRSLGFGGFSTSSKSISRSLKRLGSLKDASKSLNRSLKRLTSFKVGGKSAKDIEGYFLLLDVLTEVLSDRFARERIQRRRTPESKREPNTKEAMHHRIQHTATGIVDGMRYLHSKNIILRDLKPGNVGFDEGGNIRLFDFGMARRVSDCVQDEICGSPRYMAPEIMEGKGYTLKVDVYSFGIMLYELCTLEVPFANSCTLMRQHQKTKKRKKTKKSFGFKSIFRRKPRTSKQATQYNDENDGDSCNYGVESDQASLLIEFYRKVVFEELRPSKNILESTIVPCPQLRTLIHECWSPDPDKRPTFEEISKRLERVFNP